MASESDRGMGPEGEERGKRRKPETLRYRGPALQHAQPCGGPSPGPALPPPHQVRAQEDKKGSSGSGESAEAALCCKGQAELGLQAGGWAWVCRGNGRVGGLLGVLPRQDLGPPTLVW